MRLILVLVEAQLRTSEKENPAIHDPHVPNHRVALLHFRLRLFQKEFSIMSTFIIKSCSGKSGNSHF